MTFSSPPSLPGRIASPQCGSLTSCRAETRVGVKHARARALARTSGLATRDSRLATRDSRLTTRDSRLTTHDSRPTTHDSRLTIGLLAHIWKHCDKKRNSGGSWKQTGFTGALSKYIRIVRMATNKNKRPCIPRDGRGSRVDNLITMTQHSSSSDTLASMTDILSEY